MSEDKVKVSCGTCGTTNNFPLAARGKTVVCGRCKSPLPEPGVVLEPGPEGIMALFQNSSLPVLADFYSTTCAPCHVMHPILERLAARRAGELAVIRINVDTNLELAREFGVQGVPTFVIVHKGTERGRQVGAMDESSFALWAASRT
ncbi:MAG TPA: thioredoxin family protein [Acidobacteriota bacterium]|nr:thioredoxin family protein [Acidobacteriota bacterium]